jgi:FkbM family methyltransferase
MLKQAVHKAVRATGYDIIKHAPQARRAHHPFYLLGFLIAELMQRATGDVTFVQAGANDGATGDPLRASILRYHLRGLLIEPLPSAFAQLQQNYASEPQVRLANCAIGPTAGRATLYGDDRCASFTGTGLTTDVEVRTLPDLLAAYQLPDPSILVVDVEGLDAEIVLSALETGLRPPIVMYESIHLPRETQEDCLRRLDAAGYAFVDADVDTYAVLESVMVDTPYFGDH